MGEGELGPRPIAARASEAYPIERLTERELAGSGETGVHGSVAGVDGGSGGSGASRRTANWGRVGDEVVPSSRWRPDPKSPFILNESFFVRGLSWSPCSTGSGLEGIDQLRRRGAINGKVRSS